MKEVILIDIIMPGMSEKELYSRIIEKMPAMKNRIIIITGDVIFNIGQSKN
jgi:FixJ family two-component response regulator